MKTWQDGNGTNQCGALLAGFSWCRGSEALERGDRREKSKMKNEARVREIFWVDALHIALLAKPARSGAPPEKWGAPIRPSH